MNAVTEIQRFFSHTTGINKQWVQIGDLPANTIQVENGATFGTIQAAIDSIKEGRILIGPGEYHERIVLKDKVYLIGSSDHQTIITAPADAQMTPTLYANGNCGAGCIYIKSESNAAGMKPCALTCSGNGVFYGRGLWLLATNNAKPDNIITTIAADLTGAAPGGGMELQESSIYAFSNGLVPALVTAIQCSGDQLIQINHSVIRATTHEGIGVTVKNTTTVFLNNSSIHGEKWAVICQNIESVNIRSCEIEGPLSGDISVG